MVGTALRRWLRGLGLTAFRDPGRRGEAAAARHLKRQGLRILARNLRARSGEIDILALHGPTLVLVEVKASVGEARFDPLGRITPAKVRRIRRAAALWIRRSGGTFACWRLDGVVVRLRRGLGGRLVPDGIRWYPALHSLDSES